MSESIGAASMENSTIQCGWSNRITIYAPFFLAKRLFAKKGRPIDCLIEKKGMPEVIPSDVTVKYHPSESYEAGVSLGTNDLKFTELLISKAPLHPYFVFKAMLPKWVVNKLYERMGRSFSKERFAAIDMDRYAGVVKVDELKRHRNLYSATLNRLFSVEVLRKKYGIEN